MKTQAKKFSRLDYLRLVDEIQDYAIILLDVDGHVQNWNAGAQNIKGYSSDEILGKSFSCFYTPKDIESNKPFSLLKRAHEEGRAIDEGWRVRKDGSTFWAGIVITALHDENGEVTGFGKVTRDLTDKMVADKLREIEVKSKELEQFSYIVSHDLQEPIRTVRSYVEILFEDCGDELSADAQRFLQKIDAAMDRMQQMVVVMLDYSRLGKDKVLAKVNLNELLQNVCKDLELKLKEKKARIDFDLNIEITAYPTELTQLFQNLITNALKFQKANVSPHILINAQKIGEDYLFSVADNGIGIAPENHEKVFRVFQKLHRKEQYQGHGIGLANCKKIVELHLGEIWIESELGKGATFYFTISSKL